MEDLVANLQGPPGPAGRGKPGRAGPPGQIGLPGKMLSTALSYHCPCEKGNILVIITLMK